MVFSPYLLIFTYEAVSFGEDKNAWVLKKLEAGKKFGTELFFRAAKLAKRFICRYNM
jgi:hypothetical protein